MMRSGGERSALHAVNPALISIVMLLCLFGSVMVRSAVSGMDFGDAMFRRHLLGLAIGLIPLVVAWVIDYRKLQGWVGPLLFFCAFLIISPLVPGLGATAKGAQLWLEIAGIRLFQPSEPAKLVFIVALAAVIAGYKGKIEARATFYAWSLLLHCRSCWSSRWVTWVPHSCSRPSRWGCC